MPPRRLTAFAIVASLLIHISLLPPALTWLKERAPEEDPLAKPATVEMIVPFADWLLPDSTLPVPSPPTTVEPIADSDIEETRKREGQLGYVRTAQNQESLVAPADPSSISDRNTRLQSPDPSNEGPKDQPNVDGDDDETTDLEQRSFRDGPLLEESPSPLKPEPSQATATLTAVSQLPNHDRLEMAETAIDSGSQSEPLPELADAIPLPQPGRDPGPFDQTATQSSLEQVTSDTMAQGIDSVETLPAEEGLPAPPQPLQVPPAPSTVPLPDQNLPTFQSETRKAKLAGSAPEIGDAAFDTKNSPVGRYYKQVGVAVERKWQRNITNHHDFHAFAKIRVKFTVNRWGKAGNVEILQDKGNAVLTNQTIAAILEAKIPEMPAEVVKLLDQGELQCFFNFSIR